MMGEGEGKCDRRGTEWGEGERVERMRDIYGCIKQQSLCCYTQHCIVDNKHLLYLLYHAFM